MCNKRKASVMISHNGEVHSLWEWAKILDIPYDRLLNRINRCKWSREKAFTEPKFIRPEHGKHKPMLFYQWKRLSKLSLKDSDILAGGWDEW